MEWQQPAKILPIDPEVREAVLRIEANFERRLAAIEQGVAHLPSRVRSLVWILSSLSVLADYGISVGDARELEAELEARLPRVEGAIEQAVVTA